MKIHEYQAKELFRKYGVPVPEGRVAEVVAEGDGLDEILVEPQGPGRRAGDLRDLEGVGEAGSGVVAHVRDEDLGLVFESAKGPGMEDTVAVALKGEAAIGEDRSSARWLSSACTRYCSSSPYRSTSAWCTSRSSRSSSAACCSKARHSSPSSSWRSLTSRALTKPFGLLASV